PPSERLGDAAKTSPFRGMKLPSKADVRVRTYGPLTGTGAFWRTQAGQAVYCAMGLEPGFSLAAPATGPVVLRARIRRCRSSTGSPPSQRRRSGGQMRSIGLDIHRDFAEVAIAESGEVRSPGRIEMTPEALE